MWQNLWKRIQDFFQDKFFSSKKKDTIYEQVVDDMLEENILDNDDIDYIQNNYFSKDNNELEK